MNNADKPAFPIFTPPQSVGDIAEFGISKREFFAAKAMQAILTNHRRNVHEVAKEAYLVADAMLAPQITMINVELAKPGPNANGMEFPEASWQKALENPPKIEFSHDDGSILINGAKADIALEFVDDKIVGASFVEKSAVVGDKS